MNPTPHGVGRKSGATPIYERLGVAYELVL
jgi:hypothetical protein